MIVVPFSVTDCVFSSPHVVSDSVMCSSAALFLSNCIAMFVPFLSITSFVH